MSTVQSQSLTFQAEDGWQLTGDLYFGPSPKVAILVSSGTGFPRRFYRHMAAYMAGQGAVVLTYDYRGIGGSKTASIARSAIDLPDWGRLDMPAAIDVLEAQVPELPITHLAHSVGGHFLGLMPNHDKIARNAFLAVSTGYIGHHAAHYRPMEAYFWWGLGSYSLMRHGQLKSIGGWRGEALPPEVFKTWRRWSHSPTYFQKDFETTLTPQHYDQVRSPIRSWLFTDDPIATPKAHEVLLDAYPNAPKSLTFTSPKDLKVKRIGHEGAFKPECAPLWADVFEWLANGTEIHGAAL
jgi:predicted alpha/beta hydrolase